MQDLTIQPRHQPSPAPGRDASTHNGDSDPDADELLKRARQARGYPDRCPICKNPFAACTCGRTTAPTRTARVENAGVTV